MQGQLIEKHFGGGCFPQGGTTMGYGFTIAWQNGPLGRTVDERNRNRNGAFVEDVIAAAIGRIRFYEQSQFSCPENKEALGHLELALAALERRTLRREKQGIEGTHSPDAVNMCCTETMRDPRR